jgi:hypothetical protein
VVRASAAQPGLGPPAARPFMVVADVLALRLRPMEGGSRSMAELLSMAGPRSPAAVLTVAGVGSSLWAARTAVVDRISRWVDRMVVEAELPTAAASAEDRTAVVGGRILRWVAARTAAVEDPMAVEDPVAAVDRMAAVAAVIMAEIVSRGFGGAHWVVSAGPGGPKVGRCNGRGAFCRRNTRARKSRRGATSFWPRWKRWCRGRG